MANSNGDRHAATIIDMPKDVAVVDAKPSAQKRDKFGQQARKLAPIAAGAIAACLLISAVIIIPLAWTKTGVFADNDDEPSKQEIEALFDKWNDALQTGDPEKVAALYAPNAVLLPTVSNVPRNTHALIVDYFEHFLKLKPYGVMNESFVTITSRTSATNSGLYNFNVTRETGPDVVHARFTFEYKKIKGKWAIIEHHSSAMPEADLPSTAVVASLFDEWNNALQTGDPKKVAALYADDAVLLPTVSNKVRTNHTGVEDYFEHFLKLKPVGHIIEQHIMMPTATVVINSGVYVFNLTRNGKPDSVTARYTFVYRKVGQKWLIEEHHSSAMPEQTMPTEDEIAGLFDLWNKALATGDPNKVADRYAPDAVLLPTLSNKVRTSRAGVVDYFKEFLKKKPQGKIVERHIMVLSPTLAMDNGIYQFHFGATNTDTKARYSFVYKKVGDVWYIEEHHSSKMPEP